MTKSLDDKTRVSYSPESIIRKSKEYFHGDELAATTWMNKYALKDSKENIYESSPVEMHRRLASEFARIEAKYANGLSEEELFNLMNRFKYIIPQGGPMTGVKNPLQIASLSNCFVIGNGADSYGGIMKIDQEQVQLMKRRGGVGHDLSHIRPDRSDVNNSALTSTGVVPFMERYSNSTKEVAQDGRRGALMLSISIKHPDAEQFIDAKLEKGKVTNANVSVKVDDEFMQAVVNNKPYTQKYPIDSEEPSFEKEIDAKGLWKKIIHNAWQSAEPGVLFWDTIMRESIPDCYADLGYKTVSTNPCGEIPLCPYDSCRLLAMNLYGYVDNPFTPEAKFNFDKFKTHVHYAQRISDDIIDLEIEKIGDIQNKINQDPEDEEIKRTERILWEKIEHKAKEGRRMGLGITAEGDMLAALGLTYGTPEATDFAVEVQKTLALEAYRSSVELAKERGKFEIYDAEREKDNPFINRIKTEDPALYEDMVKYGRRNIALLTIAPTGTVSLMSQTTSGIEPVFLPAYTRKRKINSNDQNVNISFVDEQGDSWEEFNVFHQKFEDWLKIKGYNPEEVKKYNQKELDEIVSQSPYYKATSNDVDWVEKVKMQGKMQKWVDHSISVTVNLPEDISEEMVAKVYEEAWNAGCKGITVYRDGSREGVMTSKKNLEKKFELVQHNIKPHPLLEIKPQAFKYKIKRFENQDSLHVILTSDLYVDDKNKKAFFIPDEDFQIRAPHGAATSVTFAQAGMDRTEILRGLSPNYAEFVSRLESPFSSEDEGMGPKRIKSIEHAAGLIFEDYFLRNGIIGRDETTGKLVNLINKKDLRKVERGTEEYANIISQVKVADEIEIEVSGTNGKLDTKFECNKCGGTIPLFESGCHSPKCKICGHDNGISCG
jgi:ribonucleoside-diphosphate reductase alpha chain